MGLVSSLYACQETRSFRRGYYIGSITILELAIQLAKYKLNNAVRFGWWTAEEFGLVGSDHYVENLSEAERKKIALYIK